MFSKPSLLLEKLGVEVTSCLYVAVSGSEIYGESRSQPLLSFPMWLFSQLSDV